MPAPCGINKFSLNVFTEVTKIFVITVKRIEPVTSCVRGKDVATEPARHVIFKLNPIHASVIYQIP